MAKKLYIETVGCQMNVLDSELVVAALRKEGYELTSSRREADTILLNTCSVREHAEAKVYSALGRLQHVKRQRPGTIIGVLGCMAQKDQQLVLRRAPHVDLVVGPGQLHRIGALVRAVESGAGQCVEVGLDRTAGSRAAIAASHTSFDPLRDPAMRPNRYQAFVRIMIGCDKFCTYCIVPSVRGPEQSRPARQIEIEVRQLADQGCREVTLLGQTVNSYCDRSDGGVRRLADLLVRLHDIDGLARLKFITNHPNDMTDELLDAIADLPKCMPYLHVPAQSGSNEILTRMKRGYSVEAYRDMLVRIAARIPDAAVTSDFIVGFCGETEDDFEQTCALVRAARFKNSFIFKYSPRRGTQAAVRLAEDVAEADMKRRHATLLALQNGISLEQHRARIGQTLQVLVEGPSKASQKGRATGPAMQLTGRTPCDRIAVFDGPPNWIGRILPVTIHAATSFTLLGTVSEAPGTAEVYHLAGSV
jgi:tRNA-2-methylthio-N6-dimethylallyladenosine synthase